MYWLSQLLQTQFAQQITIIRQTDSIKEFNFEGVSSEGGKYH